MKPKEWNKMSADKRKECAVGLASSMRGSYIISQALWYGIKSLKSVPFPHTEVSNIEDMEILQETIFPIFAATKEAEIKFKEQKEAEKNGNTTCKN